MVDPRSGEVIAHAPPLPKDALYLKEEALAELVRRERERRRRVLAFVTHTDLRDLTPRLTAVLSRAGLRPAVLKASTVPPDRREDWIAARAGEGTDVLLANPRLVQTGLDLVEWPTLTWLEPEFSVYVMRQASRRSWRPGQRLPVEVPFLAYGRTMQAEALALVAAKMRSALMIEGELAEDGLASLESDHQDTFLTLARRLVEPSPMHLANEADATDIRSLEALFAQAREAERAGDDLLLDGAWDPLPSEPITSDTRYEGAGVASTHWQQLFDPATGADGATGASQPPDSPTTPMLVGSNVLTFEQLARLVARVRAARGRARRPAPSGQLALFGVEAA